MKPVKSVRALLPLPRLILTEALNDETSETQACFQLEIEVSFTHEDDNV